MRKKEPQVIQIQTLVETEVWHPLSKSGLNTTKPVVDKKEPTVIDKNESPSIEKLEQHSIAETEVWHPLSGSGENTPKAVIDEKEPAVIDKKKSPVIDKKEPTKQLVKFDLINISMKLVIC